MPNSWALVAVCLLPCLACSPAKEDTDRTLDDSGETSVLPATVSVSIHVADFETEAPVAGASVTLDELPVATTDDAGDATFGVEGWSRFRLGVAPVAGFHPGLWALGSQGEPLPVDVRVLSDSTADRLAAVAEHAWDGAGGMVLFTVTHRDDDATGFAGAQAALVPASDGPFYLSEGCDALEPGSRTSSCGVGYFLNVPPGEADLRLSASRCSGTWEVVTLSTLPIAANAVTQSTMTCD